MFTAFNYMLSDVWLYLAEVIRARSNYEQDNPLAHFLQGYHQTTATENPFKKKNGISYNEVKVFIYL